MKYAFNFLLIFLFSGQASSQTNNSANLAMKGNNPTAFTEYKLPKSIDSDVLQSQETELWAVVWYPQNIADLPGTRPILVFLHGNHATCSMPANTNKESCEYTQSGTCSGGMTPTPNHRGYDYTAENLASWGYVVISVNANLGITCGNGDDDDRGFILARGRLVLKHLETLYHWTLNGGLSNTTPEVDPDLLKNKLNFSQVGLMGHSRGGEGVRAALAQYNDKSKPSQSDSWKSRIPGLNIRAIFEIGAVDGMVADNVILDAPGVAWNQILPLCDGDVSSLEGRMPFERMSESRSYVESVGQQKSLEYVWGANHNYFNTEWKNDDSWGCVRHDRLEHTATGSEKQKSVGLVSMAGFFRANVGGSPQSERWNRIFNTLITPASYLNAITRIDRVFSTGFTNADTITWDDMTSADVAKTSLGFSRLATAMTVNTDLSSWPHHTTFDWTSSVAEPTIEMYGAELGTGVNVEDYATLDFRIENSDTTGTLPMSVRLKDTNNSVSNLIKLSDLSLYPVVATAHTDVASYVSIRVDLTRFSGVDFSKIQSVQFVFDAASKGKVSFAQVRFAKNLGIGLDSIDVLNVTPASNLGNVTNLRPNAEISKLKPSDVKFISSEYTPEGLLQITLESASGFPVRDAAPQLVVDGKTYKKSKYLDGKDLNQLTFVVRKSELSEKMKKASKKSLRTGSAFSNINISLQYDGALGESKVKIH